MNLKLLAWAVVSALVFVWSHRFLPMQDWPDWIVQGSLLADALRGQLAPFYSVKPGPVPNVISSVLIGLLSLLVRPEIAGKLVLSGYVVGMAAASYYLLRAGRAVVPVGILVASLLALTSFPFFHGEINYALGLIVLYVGQGFLLRRSACDERRIVLGVLAVTTLVFFCHGACYALWLLFLVAYAWNARSLRCCLGLAVAVAPSLVLTALYTASKAAEPGAVVQGGAVIEIAAGFPKKLWLVFKFLAPFQGFYPFFETWLAWLLVVGNFAGLAFALYIVARWAPTVRTLQEPQLGVLRKALVLYGAAFVLAPQAVGGLLNPAERVVLPAFHLVLTTFALLRPEPSRTAMVSHARAGWALLVIHAIYLHGYGGFVSSRLESAYEKLYEYAVRPAAALLHESHFRFQGEESPARPLAWRLLPLHFPMLRLTYYARLEAGHALPIFETGQFRSAAERLLNQADAAASAAGEGPVLIVGWPPGNRAVARLLPKQFKMLEPDSSSFLVMGQNGAASGDRGR